MAQDPQDGPDRLPPVPEPELSEAALCALVDDGNVAAVEQALYAQQVRVPAVLEQIERVLAAGSGNLGAVLATMLISRFRVAEANTLADGVLGRSETAGADELVDLVAALMQQERLRSATRVLDVALARQPEHHRGLYFRGRLLARTGDLDAAFENIARVSPNVLGAAGLAIQARYAALTGRAQAYAGALKAAQKRAKDDDQAELDCAIHTYERATTSGADLTRLDLRTALAIEYGCLLIETAADRKDQGRFGADPITAGDTGRLVQTMRHIVEQITPAPKAFLYATEHGEVVACGLAQLTGRHARPWQLETRPEDGDWLCMGSAATHPHLPNTHVARLHRALDEGVLRSLALVLPAGWRAPIVPDLIGRITRDDEFPWAIDDEIQDIYDAINEDQASDDLVHDENLFSVLPGLQPLLRSAREVPRPGHVPYRDETSVAVS